MVNSDRINGVDEELRFAVIKPPLLYVFAAAKPEDFDGMAEGVSFGPDPAPCWIGPNIEIYATEDFPSSPPASDCRPRIEDVRPLLRGHQADVDDDG
jgi:hypothetical protein